MKIQNIIFLILGIVVILYLLSLPVFLSSFPDKSYTEVFFNDYENLPDDSKDISNNPISFTIYNKNQKPVYYFYEIFAESDNKQHILNAGSVEVGARKSAIISFNLLSDSSQIKAPMKIIVKIKNTNQEIHFWIN